jgi:DNA-binding transcriptional MerR regulator
MRIGEFARRIGVTPRAVRHYESVGLLRPARIDERTGYRHYGAAELVRAVRIEQLKRSGLPLASIAHVLDDGAATEATLRRRRHELCTDLAATRRQLRMLDALLAAGAALSDPALTTTPSAAVVVATIAVDARGLTPCIRRGVQRLRRRVRTLDAAAPWTFAARIPLTVTGPSTIEVGASHPRLGGRHAVWSSQRAVVVEVTGPHELLPAAYDAALAHARDRRLHPTGVVQETYVRLGPVPHTSIAVFVGDGGRDPAAPPAAVSPARR